MNRAVKAILYLVLLAAVCVLGVKFSRIYRAVMRTSPPQELVDRSESPTAAPSGASNGAPATNLIAFTNPPLPTATASATNDPAATNATARTPAAAQAKGPRPRLAAPTNAAPASPGQTPAEPTFSSLATHGIVLFAVTLCLGVLLAHDFSHLVAERFHKFILSDEGEGIKAPEYDRAEQVWADGRHLEAIQLMRDYLKRHPRELYVALRIAEIYEKDLGNYLAAVLEYEEVLKHHLRPEQWGWAAIHLANLYSGKLNQTDKAVALLRRIDSEYGETSAAVKARARLSQLEGAAGESNAIRVEIEEDPTPPSHLPKGFRPKTKAG
jgi:TolA-binding protein